MAFPLRCLLIFKSITVGFIYPRCLPGQKGWCAVSSLQAASGAHEWCAKTTPYPLATVVTAWSGSGIQQPILHNSTLQAVLTPKSNCLEVYIIIFPHPSVGNVYSGPWVKIISQTSLPLLEARLIQTVFPNMLLIYPLLGYVEVLIGQGQLSW